MVAGAAVPDTRSMRQLLLACLVAVGVGAAVRPAFTAPAGAAAGAVSGYSVSDVSYSLDDARVSSVSFTLRPAAASTVRARVGSSWSRCSTRAGRATCTFETPLPPLAALRTLTVVAAG
jgi:hypothetical protein